MIVGYFDIRGLEQLVMSVKVGLYYSDRENAKVELFWIQTGLGK